MGEGLADSLARVVVIGCSGSGKSTLARKLAQALAAPWVQLDELYWGPQWQPRPDSDFLQRADTATRGPRWIVDGNYHRTREIVWPRATALVWLNYTFPTVFARSLRRTIMRGVTREVLFSGNRESLWRAFTSRESILWWVVTSHRRGRREYGEVRDSGRYPRLAWIELRAPSDSSRFLRDVAGGR